MPTSVSYQPEKSVLDYFNRQNYLGNEYSLGLNSVAVTTSEANVALLTNSSSNLQSCFLHKIALGATGVVFVRLYSHPTVTGVGTPVVPVNLNLGSGRVASTVCSQSPTTSANGSFLFCAGTAAGGLMDAIHVIVSPGSSLLVTAQAVASGTLEASFIFYEV